jgi:hypothetical protein
MAPIRHAQRRAASARRATSAGRAASAAPILRANAFVEEADPAWPPAESAGKSGARARVNQTVSVPQSEEART